jgi:Tfp pilus assembly protein PilF
MQHRQDIDGAERELRAAMKCDPQHTEVRRNLDTILASKLKTIQRHTLLTAADDRSGSGACSGANAGSRKKGKRKKKRRGEAADSTDGADHDYIETDRVYGTGAGAGKGAASDANASVGAGVSVGEHTDPSPSTKKKAARKPCGSCGKLVEGTLKCGRCKSTCYCSRDCQKAHWKHGGHKHECRPLVEAAKVVPAATVVVQMEGMSLGSDSGSTTARDSNDEDECAICLDLVNGTNSRQLPCGHVYHRECVQELRKRGVNDLCPQCRAPLPPGAEEAYYQATMLGVRAERMSKGSVQDRLITEVEHLLREVLQEDPSHALAHDSLGVILLEYRQDIDGAEREYRAAIKCDPQHANAHCNLGAILLEHRQDIDGAEREIRAAIKCDPQHANSHCNLAVILYSRYDIDGAERVCRTAIKCDPQHTKAHGLLDRILASKRTASMTPCASQGHTSLTAAGDRSGGGAGSGVKRKKKRSGKVADCTEGAGHGNIEKGWTHGPSAASGAVSDANASVGAGVSVGEHTDPPPSTKGKSARKPCGSCGKLVEGTLKCGRCKSTYYCSRKCQKVHWKAGGHKQECRLAPAKQTTCLGGSAS